MNSRVIDSLVKLMEEKGLKPEPQWLREIEQKRFNYSQVKEEFLKKGKLTEVEFLEVISEDTGYPLLNKLSEPQCDISFLTRLPITFVKKHCVIPFDFQDDVLYVLTGFPYDRELLDNIRTVYEFPVKPFLAPEYFILSQLTKSYESERKSTEDVIKDMGEEKRESEFEFELENEPEDLLDGHDAPIVKLVNAVIMDAIRKKSSDIHIEPYEKELQIRYRIDGILHLIPSPEKKYFNAIISRIKIMSRLDISEKRLPQDGRIKIRVGNRFVDIRVSTLPSIYGERVVMRILDVHNVLLGLDQLGFSPQTRDIFEQLILCPNGILLVTGPTGSGKTTTLYSALETIRSPEKNIITIEDPVEYQLKGISQIQTNDKIEFDFPEALRSILRQDPDIIMVGEIRDVETARIAIQASLTGHLVFSTLHTNDSVSSIMRLKDMGVEPYLISTSVIGILAQRLVRKLCKKCCVEREVDDKTRDSVGFTKFGIEIQKVYDEKGCSECGFKGYSGQIGIYELLTIDDVVRQKIVAESYGGGILEYVQKKMTTLRHDGLLKVKQGITSLKEIMRVTQGDIS